MKNNFVWKIVESYNEKYQMHNSYEFYRKIRDCKYLLQKHMQKHFSKNCVELYKSIIINIDWIWRCWNLGVILWNFVGRNCVNLLRRKIVSFTTHNISFFKNEINNKKTLHLFFWKRYLNHWSRNFDNAMIKIILFFN